MEPTLVPPPDRLPPGPYTWDDFLELAEDDPRELLDGHFVEVEVATQLHEYIVSTIHGYLWSWARAHNAGITLTSGYKVQVTRLRGVMPDLQFYRHGRLPREAQQGLVGGRPDLAVEVISQSSRAIDSVTKLNWYASIGVPEYWLVDPEGRTLFRFVLLDDRYVVEPHGGEDTFTPETFAGLAIPLAELWVIPGGSSS
jgi:Uma2 family endonuclease